MIEIDLQVPFLHRQDRLGESDGFPSQTAYPGGSPGRDHGLQTPPGWYKQTDLANPTKTFSLFEKCESNRVCSASMTLQMIRFFN